MKTMIILMLLAILLSPISVLAVISQPILIDEINVSETQNINFDGIGRNQIIGIEDNVVAVSYQVGLDNKLVIFNGVTGTVYFQDTQSGLTTHTMGYEPEGYLWVMMRGAIDNRLFLYDVSDAGFISLEATCTGFPQQSFPTNPYIPPSDEVVVFTELDSSQDFTVLFNGNLREYNGVSCSQIATGQPNFQFADRSNNRLISGNTLYNLIDEQTFVATTETFDASAGYIVDWNRNSTNPEFLLSTGRILITGGFLYPNLQATGVSPSSDKDFFIHDRGYIVSTVNASFHISDFSEPSEPNEQTYTATNILSGVQTNPDAVPIAITNNRLFTWGYEDGLIKSFSIPEPQPQEIIGETPPSVEADFLGTTVNGDFIFSTTMQDAQGGRVYLSQSLYEASVEPSESFTLVEEVDFSNLNVLNQIDDLKFTTGTAITNPDYLNASGLFDNVLELRPRVNELIEINFNDVALSTEAENVSYEFIIAPYDSFEADLFDITFELSAISDTGAEIFRYRVNTDFFGVDDVNIEHYTGSYTSVFTGDTYDVAGQKDFYIFNAEINFTSQTSFVTISNANSTLYSASIPFLESASSLSGTRMNILDGSGLGYYYYHFAYMGYEQETSIENTLDYEIFGVLDSGETLVKATYVEGNFPFGDYTLYSYATDDEFGLSYINSFDIESFTYSETTETLTQDDIEELIEAGQTEIDTGLVDFVEGDLLTDTFAGALETAGLKSTASKLFLAVVLILVFVASGYSYGIIGSVIGGIGGLILAFFLGWIPVWIVVTLILGLIAVASFEARRLVTGGR